MIPPLEIINVNLINASEEHVWDAPVNPEKTSPYNPPHRLPYTVFDPSRGIADTPMHHLQVTYLPNEVKEQTKLTVILGGFEYAASGQERYEEVQNNGVGWNPIFQKIAELVEQEKG
jgi:uncharacterized protein YndB with AHSA1/START domain